MTVTNPDSHWTRTRSRPLSPHTQQKLEPAEQANVNAPTSAAPVAQKSDGETSLYFRQRSQVRFTACTFISMALFPRTSFLRTPPPVTRAPSYGADGLAHADTKRTSRRQERKRTS